VLQNLLRIFIGPVVGDEAQEEDGRVCDRLGLKEIMYCKEISVLRLTQLFNSISHLSTRLFHSLELQDRYVPKTIQLNDLLTGIQK